MANLPEQETYDAGVYQIEQTDPVLGGVDGPDNAGARNLANRTAWLKARQLEAAATASEVTAARGAAADLAARLAEIDDPATANLATATAAEVTAARGAAADLAARLATFNVAAKFHGADAAAARPEPFAVVIWFGSAQPTQLATNDLLITTP